MPVIKVPAAPTIALFMNVLRDPRLSSGSIIGYRSCEVSVCLESESVQPGNHRVSDRNLVNIAPLQFGEEIAGDHFGFSAQSFWKRGSFRSGSNIGSSRS